MPELLNDVPQANQTLGTTQPLIRTNFSNIDAAFQVDHIGYTLPGQGKHAKVTFPVQGSAPVITIPDVALVSLLNAYTTHNELNFINDAGGIVAFTASDKNINGWTYLPSGILLKWGLADAPANGTFPVTFPVGGTIPPFAAIYSLQISPSNTAVAQIGPKIVTFGTLNFQVFNPGSNGINVTYFAIGS